MNFISLLKLARMPRNGGGGGEARDMPARRKFFSGNGIFYSNMLYTERLECECKSIFQHNHFNMTGNVPQSACLQNLHVHF